MQLHGQRRSRFDKPLPLPVPPAVDVSGPFALLPGGGVRVGGMSIAVDRGTRVERTDLDSVGLNDGTGQTGQVLCWDGRLGERNEGRWTLFLLGANESDLTAVHRILLFLPPTTHAAPAPPVPASSPYRNSLFLYDERSRSVIGVIPLSSDPPSCSAEPAPHSLQPAHLHPSEPSPKNHPSASGFAAYIDHVVGELSPTPTAEQLSADERREADKRDRLAEEEERSDELPIPLPFIDYAVRRGSSSAFDPICDLDCALELEEDGEGSTEHDRRRLEQGLKRLDLEMELAADPVPPRTHPSEPREPSSWTVSSFATYGTEHFQTADEGDEGSWTSFTGASTAPAGAAHVVEEGDDDGGAEETPRPTLLPTSPSPSSAPNPTPSSAKPPAPVLVDTRAHTLSNSNAVLLSFLGAPSALLPAFSSASPLTRVTVSAHPLSQREASEMTLRGEIVVAEMDDEAVGESSQGKDKGEGKEGWWAWLSGLWQPAAAPSSTASSASGGWLSWLPSLFTSPSAAPADASSSSPSSPATRIPRKAGAGTTSRYSVYYVDGEGRGRRAYVTR
ncbi:hypothetical protein JCM10213v2_006014 [Rhodosporidiobolus nylandii]